MQRRTFSKALTASAALGLTGCPLAGQESAPEAAPSGAVPHMGTNLSGMEWARPGLRYGLSSQPNVHFSVPRKAEVAYLAACRFTRNRLPVQWELLQPMLHDTKADAAARAAIGEPGALHEGYASFIDHVLDAHAAAGIRCIVDLHNYCRYQDFIYQPDGSVRGLVKRQDLLRPYTSDSSQVQVRIFSLADKPSLSTANFADVWRRAATRWARHPGFGGYGLMNEPNNLPRPGEREASTSGEDLMIWPAYAKAAIDAIRAVDPQGPIYVAGNVWSAAMAIGSQNPAFPLAAANLVYEVHLYLDAASNGAQFDYDTEVAKKFSAGQGSVAINRDTGLARLRIATDWAKAHRVPLALTEVGMPIDDPRWGEMFQPVVDHAVRNGCEVYSWMGGNHWPIRNAAMNHAPGWHQNRTLEPAVSGRMKAAARIAQATLYDDLAAPSAGGPIEVVVYARGNLAAPVRLTISADKGGTLSKRELTLPAGPNGSDSFRFSPVAGEIATLSYRRADGGQVPPARKVYPLAGEALVSARPADAAMAVIERYRACKWELGDGYTDYVLGEPAAPGKVVRAVADSGRGSTMGNAMEMLNWFNDEGPAMGPVALPVMRVTAGRKHSDHSGAGVIGFWCKKSAAVPGTQPHPLNRVPYNLEDPHFVLAAVAVPGDEHSGVVFQASQSEARQASELLLQKGRPQARWTDSAGTVTELTGEEPLAPGRVSVLCLISRPGEQQLRVNAKVVARGTANLAASEFTQMLIGWGFLGYYPREGFGGHVYAVIAGRGAPSTAELQILERFLVANSASA